MINRVQQQLETFDQDEIDRYNVPFGRLFKFLLQTCTLRKVDIERRHYKMEQERKIIVHCTSERERIIVIRIYFYNSKKKNSHSKSYRMGCRRKRENNSMRKSGISSMILITQSPRSQKNQPNKLMQTMNSNEFGIKLLKNTIISQTLCKSLNLYQVVYSYALIGLFNSVQALQVYSEYVESLLSLYALGWSSGRISLEQLIESHLFLQYSVSLCLLGTLY